MSDTQHRAAPTRSAVLCLHAAAYRQRMGVSHEEWCEALDTAYCHLVPADQRSVKAPCLKAITTAKEYVARLRSWDQQVRRWEEGDVRMPVDVEEAWVEALPEPYRSECRRELAQRMGLWGAVRSEAGPAGDYECWSRALHSFSEVTRAMGCILADGEIGPQDAANLEELIAKADAMRSDLTSLIERSRTAIDTGAPADVTQLRRRQ